MKTTRGNTNSRASLANGIPHNLSPLLYVLPLPLPTQVRIRTALHVSLLFQTTKAALRTRTDTRVTVTSNTGLAYLSTILYRDVFRSRPIPSLAEGPGLYADRRLLSSERLTSDTVLTPRALTSRSRRVVTFRVPKRSVDEESLIANVAHTCSYRTTCPTATTT